MATCPCECAAFRLEPSRLLHVACGMKSTLFPECGQWIWPLRNFHAGPLLWGQSDWKRAEGGLTDLIGARLHSKLSFYSQSLIWGGLGDAKTFGQPKSKLSPLHQCLWGFLFSALSSPVLSPGPVRSSSSGVPCRFPPPCAHRQTPTHPSTPSWSALGSTKPLQRPVTLAKLPSHFLLPFSLLKDKTNNSTYSIGN